MWLATFAWNVAARLGCIAGLHSDRNAVPPGAPACSTLPLGAMLVGMTPSFRLPPVEPLVVTGYQRSTGPFGPDREADCPCGSLRRIRSCHGTRGGPWREPLRQPLHSGPVTGLSRKGCYASALRDCGGSISNEHWLSENILRALTVDGLPPMLSGLPWLNGATKALPPQALGSNVLCERHNTALSGLDREAGIIFRHAHRVQEHFDSRQCKGASEMLLVSGSGFELWLLKLLLGGVAAESFGDDGVPIEEVRWGAERTNLAGILFRGEPWPDDWGFHVRVHSVDLKAQRLGVAIGPATFPGGGIAAMVVSFGVFEFTLALGRSDRPRDRRPGGLVVTDATHPCEQVLAFAWPDGGERVVRYLHGE